MIINLRLFTVIQCSAFLILTTTLLAGCGRPLVMPKRTAMWTQGQTVDAGFACEGFLDRSPLPSFNPASGFDFSVGVKVWFIPGADPVPCWRRHEYRAIGLVRWDLRIAENLIGEGYRLDRAELVQRINPTAREYGDYWEGSTLASVLVAAETWEAGNRTGSPADPALQVATTRDPVVTTVPFAAPADQRERRVDVTALVNRWLNGDLPNHGLVYDSVTFGLGEDVTRTMETEVDVDLVLHLIDP